MTTLLAGRGTTLELLLQELRSFVRSLMVADRGDDEAATRFCWPRGL